MARTAHSRRTVSQTDAARRMNFVVDERRDDESGTRAGSSEGAPTDDNAQPREDAQPDEGESFDEDADIEAAVEAIVSHPIFEMSIETTSETDESASTEERHVPFWHRLRVGFTRTPVALRTFFLSRGFSQALGIVGETLITLGVIVMLFLGWQLWVNDVIIFNQSSAVAEKNIQKWTTTKTSSPTASGDPTAPVDYGPAPVMAAVAENEVFGNLYIPRFGNNYVKVVANGVSPDGTLNCGYFGRYPDSAWPGEAGNFAVAVHRAGHGSPFRNAPQLRTGDLIVLQTPKGYYEYTVRNTEYVLPTAVEVVNAVPGGSSQAVPGQSVLTITTCNPELGNNERLITYAVLSGWRPADAGPPDSIAKMVTS